MCVLRIKLNTFIHNIENTRGDPEVIGLFP